jgi:Holliday junction DNA helicase RuvB
MIDRCQSVNLEHYSVDNIKKILKQYNNQLYQLNVDEEVYDLLAINTRYTPRLAINYFDDFVICQNINKVLSAHQIIKNSLTINDIIVLKHLKELGKPTGVEVLAIITQQTKQDFMILQEPFLIMENYISRTSRGRTITDKGKQILGDINNV